MGRLVYYDDLGEIKYQKAWDFQTQLFQSIIDRKVRNRKLTEEEQEDPFHYLLFCEHPHVYTLGRNGKVDHLLLDEDGLKEHQASFVKINRGGDITYHGYGQLVGYPIVDLDEFFADIARYIRYIEEVVIRTIAEYGLKGERIKGLSGVWLDVGSDYARKICAVGMHLSRWVSMHGFALNVNTNLSYFGHIVPCGIEDENKGVTSLANELGRTVPLEEVQEKIVRHFAEVFEADLVAKALEVPNEL
ncbi:MAG: lipoyl(octanoyl) transferase LipB [Saprospiraceae bacterium]|nr:lipoyl(octanoyl) transferase LipB [Saprospiraceae bacterium]